MTKRKTRLREKASNAVMLLVLVVGVPVSSVPALYLCLSVYLSVLFVSSLLSSAVHADAFLYDYALPGLLGCARALFRTRVILYSQGKGATGKGPL